MSVLSDGDAEKRKNIRLALGVAAAGVLGLFSIYVIFIAVMFFSPWLLPSIMPFPSLSEQVAGIDGKLLIFSKEIKFKRASYENASKETATLRTFDGKTLSDPVEVPSFHSLYPAGDKVYLFDEGLYRIFDGKAWTEVKARAIGNCPIGATDGGNVWVLSAFNGKTALNLLRENETREIALPVDPDKISLRSSQLLSVGGKVHLIWEDGYTLFWNRFDGEKWGSPKTFDSDARYRALVFKDKIFLFGSSRYSEKPYVNLWTYDGNDWTKSVALPVNERSMEIIPAVFRGKPVLLQRGFFTDKFYVLDEQGQIAEGPLTIRKPSFFPRYAWKLATRV